MSATLEVDESRVPIVVVCEKHADVEVDNPNMNARKPSNAAGLKPPAVHRDPNMPKSHEKQNCPKAGAGRAPA